MNEMLKNSISFDIECFPNFFMIAMKRVSDKREIEYHIFGENEKFDRDVINKIKNIFIKRRTFGFNINNYDNIMIAYALTGATCNQLWKMNCKIIDYKGQGWMFIRDNKLKKITQNAFDLIQVTPGVASLKMYATRLHRNNLVNMPHEVGAMLTHQDADEIIKYCFEDTDIPIELLEVLSDQMEIRISNTLEYDFDMLSKSDAQMAEAIIKIRMANITGRRYTSPKFNPKLTFKYLTPSFISFKTEAMKDVLWGLEDLNFGLNQAGSVTLPKELTRMSINIPSTRPSSMAKTSYKIGIGGLHSKEKAQTIIPNHDQKLIDKDAAAFYPFIILNLGLYPKRLGPVFLKVYREIVEKRLKSKEMIYKLEEKIRNGDDSSEMLKALKKWKIRDGGLKIEINGLFGKLGNKYSIVYSPDLLLRITITGQLSLLMLIEELELNDIYVVSANTDGFVSLVDNDKYELYEDICAKWEDATRFELEATEYKALMSQSVNSYFAIKPDGTHKGKGIFAKQGLGTNPQASICAEAVIEYVKNGTPLRSTINNCIDIRKFIIARNVAGGAVFKGNNCGKVVRWVWTHDESNVINYKKNGNKVPLSDYGEPVDVLSDYDMSNINRELYFDKASKMIELIGYNKL